MDRRTRFAVGGAVCLSLALHASSTAQAQSKSPGAGIGRRAHAIKLASGVIRTDARLSNGDRTALVERAQGRAGASGRVHLLVQFEKLPEKHDRARLAALGVQLVAFVPNAAWVASVPLAVIETLAFDRDVRWIGQLSAAEKVSPEIRSESFGSWNYDRASDEVTVVVEFPRDVESERGLEILRSFGATTGEMRRSIHAVTARVPRAALMKLAAMDEVLFVEAALPPLSEVNDGQRDAHNVDTLLKPPYNPSPTYGLSGSGIDVLVYDSGQVADHPDFGSRLTHGDGAVIREHSTHVAGTVGGDGSQSAANGGVAFQWHGVAPSTDIISFGYEAPNSGTIFYDQMGDIEDDWDDAKNSHGADLGTASLGSNVGLNGYPCSLMGRYGATSELLDNIVRGSLGEPYIATWANGNERDFITCSPDYTTVSPPSCAKNPIMIGASNSNDDSMTGFSSWGPCLDGRLKPIVTAAGCQNGGDDGITSTDTGSGYIVKCGTSMATPGVAGMLALMLEQYRKSFGGNDEFLPSTAKALLMNTAVEAGTTGPDYQFGYGLVDPKAAVDAVAAGRFREGSVDGSSTVREYAVLVTGGSPVLKVSLAWDDPSVSPLTDDALVNDLDLELVSPLSVTHEPWVLDPSDPGDAATTGSDEINNQEQVTVNAPAAGIWLVRVRGDLVPDAPQTFSLASTHELVALDILAPTSAVPSDVGEHDDPELLLVRLDLNNKFGSPLTLPISPAIDLSFEVGGIAALAVVLGAPVGSEYWVLIQPPNQAVNGCYDLEVGLYGLLFDTEDSSVCYGPAMHEDTILVVDRSGSMSSDGKIEAAKDATQFFITAMAIDDMIGAGSFADTGGMDFGLTLITTSAIKTAASLTIEGYPAMGQTALGQGMQAADVEMGLDSDPDHDHTIVLLSDGNQNVLPFWENVVGSMDPDTVIHTIGLGPVGDPDETLLADIASDFNGTYSRVYTGASAPDSTSAATETANVLADAYRRAAEDAFTWDRLFEASEKTGSCRTPITHTILVEAGRPQVVFAAHWSQAMGTLTPITLTRPNGTVVTVAAPDVIEHRSMGTVLSSGHEQFKIRNPAPGTWRLRVTPSQQRCPEYLALAETRSNTNLVVLTPGMGEIFHGCAPIPLRATLVAGVAPVLNAQISAKVVGHRGFRAAVTLADDGRHQDGAAGDGLFGGDFSPCLQGQVVPGTLEAKFTARASQGQLVRTVVRSFLTRQ